MSHTSVDISAARSSAIHSRNRVGVAPDAEGKERICYAGASEPLMRMEQVPGACYWPSFGCLSLPANKDAVLCIETLGELEESTDEYVALMERLLKPLRKWTAMYPKTPPGLPTPFKHQIACFGWALDTFDRGIGGFANLCDMGTGKTRWGVDMLRFQTSLIGIVVGKRITLGQWEEALQSGFPECDCWVLSDTLKSRAAKMEEYSKPMAEDPFWEPQKPTIFVTNWDVVWELRHHLQALKPDLMIADESIKIANRTNKMAKGIKFAAKHCRKRVLMNGTLFGKDPGDAWSQYQYADSHIFGDSYWDFMNEYFLLGGYSGNDFQAFRPDKMVEFVRRLYSCAFRVSIACTAEVTHRVVRLPATEAQRKHYDAVAEFLYSEVKMDDGRKGKLNVNSALAKCTRLQQLCAGIFPMNEIDVAEPEDEQTYAYAESSRADYPPPDPDHLSDYQYIDSAKTEWLMEYLEDLISTTDARVMVWTKFRPELQRIVEDLAAASWIDADQYGVIQGGVKDTVRDNLRAQVNDRRSPMRLLVCQIQAAAFGFDLPEIDKLIYHSSTFSYSERKQSERRGLRAGRTRPYEIIDLVLQNTVDCHISRAIQRRQSLGELLLVTGFGRFIEGTDSEAFTNLQEIGISANKEQSVE